MKRRNFIAGLGALSAGGAAALGTGAFSSVEAERDVSVELADDADAYLALESTSQYAEPNGDGVLELDFGTQVDVDDEELGEHVGEDSTYFFGSGSSDRNVFEVENQGTQEVEVSPGRQVLYFDGDGDIVNDPEPAELAFDLRITGDSAVTLGPGESVGYYLAIVTTEDAPDTAEGTFEINANEV